MPGTAHCAAEHLVGMIVIRESFCFRVPSKLAFKRHGDIAQVADARGAVSDFGRGGRFAIGLDAIEEVAMMVVALIQVCFVGPYHGCLQRLRLRRDPAAPDLDPALAALKTHRPAGVRFARQFHPIGVSRPVMDLGDGGEQAVCRILGAQVLEFYRPGAVGAVGPLRNVDKMGAEICGLAA